MTKQEIKQTLSEQAAIHGFALVYSDLRSGCFHVKNGAIVKMGHVWRNITPPDLAAHVRSVCVYGTLITH
jgi:hypothetical protein